MSAEYAEEVIRTVMEPLVVLDGDLQEVSANPSFYRILHATPQETEGHLRYDLRNRQWDIPEFREIGLQRMPINTRWL